MKYFLSLFLFFFIISSSAISDLKIVFVDMDRLVSLSKAGSSIFRQLKDINNKNLIFLKNEEKKFKEKENKFTEADFTNKVDKLKSEINNYNQDRNKMIQEFNKLKVENTNNLLKQINPILTKYSTENEISIILQKKDLIIGKTELDITDEIITIINDEIKEFKIK